MSRKPSTKFYSDQKFEFTNVEFGEKEERDYEQWLKQDAPDEFEAITFFCNAGFRVQFSLGVDNDSPTVSITRIDDTKEDYNRCLSSSGNDLADALQISLFKYDVLLEGGYLPKGGKREKRARR